MTQSIADTLNNLEQFMQADKGFAKLNDAKFNKFSKQDDLETDTVGMDKALDFKKVLDSKVENGKSTINDVKEGKGLSNNTQVSADSDSEALVDFKAVLKEFADESNVESALDLTLAKDVGEIISQLKEAVEDVAQAIEDESEEVVSDIAINVDSLIVQEEDTTAELDIPADTEKEELGDVEVKVPFEQVLTFVDKSMVADNDFQVVEQSVENTVESLLETFSNTQSEIIEFSENITNEVAKSDSNNIELEIDEEILKDLNIQTLSVESDASEGETLMQNQTPEEHSVKVMINQDVEVFDLKLDSVTNQQNNYTTQANATEINPSKLIDQISKHIENLHNGSKVNIVLNPESLGKVSIQLMTTKEGLTAQFTVATQEARDLLMKGLDGLKETLTSHGVGVDNVSVKVADSQKSEYNQDWTEQEDGSRGGNKGQQNPEREEKEKGLFEKMMAQTVEQNENGKV